MDRSPVPVLAYQFVLVSAAATKFCWRSVRARSHLDPDSCRLRVPLIRGCHGSEQQYISGAGCRSDIPSAKIHTTWARLNSLLQQKGEEQLCASEVLPHKFP